MAMKGMKAAKKVSVPKTSRAAMSEPLLAPTLVGEASGGLAQLVADAIKKRDKDGALESTEHGKDGTGNWYASVVLAGGSTCMPGLPQRITHELGRVAPTPCTPAVLAPPERAHAAWIGASILGSLAVAGQIWISKEEYDENGPLIVHRKVRACYSPRACPLRLRSAADAPLVCAVRAVLLGARAPPC